MVLSILSQNMICAENTTDKTKRQVYLHAFDETPNVNTSENRHTVYMGEDVNVFLAVDNPNKGTYLDADDPVVLAAAEETRIKATK